MRLTRNLSPSSPISLLRSGGSSNENRTVAVSTAGELFAAGGGIELIREPETGLPTLLMFDGRNHQVGRRIQSHGRMFELM